MNKETISTPPIPDFLEGKPPCHCDHKITGTGGIFYQGWKWIYCTICEGIQPIRKPVDWGKKDNKKDVA